jgi:hypothetical protein
MNKDKYSSNQLPCKTFVSCGQCGYHERCHFLHDYRIMNKNSKITTKKKDLLNDTDNIFFWPKMNNENNENNENNNKYLCNYNSILNSNNNVSYDNLVIYSIWNHFILSINNQYKMDDIDNSVINRYTNRKRLDIFVYLSRQ